MRKTVKKLVGLLAVFTFVMSLFVLCPVRAPAEALPADIPAEKEPADLALERLNRYAETVMEQKENSFGYPGNLDIRLTGFGCS